MVLLACRYEIPRPARCGQLPWCIGNRWSLTWSISLSSTSAACEIIPSTESLQSLVTELKLAQSFEVFSGRTIEERSGTTKCKVGQPGRDSLIANNSHCNSLISKEAYVGLFWKINMALNHRFQRLDDRNSDPRTQVKVSLERSNLRKQAFRDLGRHSKTDTGIYNVQNPDKLSINCCWFCRINTIGSPNCNPKGRLLRRVAIFIKILEPFAACAS